MSDCEKNDTKTGNVITIVIIGSSDRSEEKASVINSSFPLRV